MLDRKKLVQVAQKLGLEIEFDSRNPGFFFEESSSLIPFSELKSISIDNILNENITDKETYNVKIVSSKIPNEKRRKVNLREKRIISYSYGQTRNLGKAEYTIENKSERTFLKSETTSQDVLAA